MRGDRAENHILKIVGIAAINLSVRGCEALWLKLKHDQEGVETFKIRGDCENVHQKRSHTFRHFPFGRIDHQVIDKAFLFFQASYYHEFYLFRVIAGLEFSTETVYDRVSYQKVLTEQALDGISLPRTGVIGNFQIKLNQKVYANWQRIT
jgi:hypothetical protein